MPARIAAALLFASLLAVPAPFAVAGPSPASPPVEAIECDTLYQSCERYCTWNGTTYCCKRSR